MKEENKAVSQDEIKENPLDMLFDNWSNNNEEGSEKENDFSVEALTESLSGPLREEEFTSINLEERLFYPDEDNQTWQLNTGLNLETLCGAIEALIFMSDRPVPLLKIKNQIDQTVPLRVLHECISRLQEDYEKAHHGIRLLEVAEGYQFRTKSTYSKFIQNLFKVQSLILGPGSLEVLAIIAYKQPVARTEIDKIRGVDSSHLIRGLMDKRIVTVIGRSDDMGRPVLYGTTQEFLEVFSLKNLQDLPPEHELSLMSQSSSVGEISDIKSLITETGGKIFNRDELDELDELSKSIKSITTETTFTRGLSQEDKKEVGQVRKSAFDLLEDYLLNQEVAAQNKESVQSADLLMIQQKFSGQGDTLSDLLVGFEEAAPKNQQTVETVEQVPLSSEHFWEGELFEQPQESFQQQDALADKDEEVWEDVIEEEISQQIIEEVIFEEGAEQLFEDRPALSEESEKKSKELDLDLSFLRNRLERPFD